MIKLAQEQLKTLEDAFYSLPEDMRTGIYRNMENKTNTQTNYNHNSI